MTLGDLVQLSLGNHITLWNTWRGIEQEVAFILHQNETCIVIDIDKFDGMTGIKVLGPKNKTGWISEKFLTKIL